MAQIITMKSKTKSNNLLFKWLKQKQRNNFVKINDHLHPYLGAGRRGASPWRKQHPDPVEHFSRHFCHQCSDQRCRSQCQEVTILLGQLFPELRLFPHFPRHFHRRHLVFVGNCRYYLLLLLWQCWIYWLLALINNKIE